MKLLYFFTVALGLWSCKAGAELLSLNKPVTSSGAYSSAWLPQQLTDGDTRNTGSDNVLQGTCAHTSTLSTPVWFTIDLQGNYLVEHVKIYNRMNCCNDRLAGAKIFVSRDDGHIFTKKAVQCGDVALSDAGVQDVKCHHGIYGRYAHVIQESKRRVPLNICEMDVYGVPAPSAQLLSMGKPVTTSGAYSSTTWLPKQLTDGKTTNTGSNNLLGTTCASTSNNPMPPWFTIDLTDFFLISNVKIINRMNCCNDRLAGAKIYISAVDGDLFTKKAIQCGDQSLTEEGEQVVTCQNGVFGRYVHVIEESKPGVYLNICEMEAYGVLASPPDLISENKPVTTSGAYGNTWIPKQLTDGKTRNTGSNHVLRNTCAHTSTQSTPPWFTIDLIEHFYVKDVRIFNRMNCCNDRLAGAKVYISNDNIDMDSNKQFECGSGLTDESLQEVTCPRIHKVRYVHIIQEAKSGVPLNICEVQVFGNKAIIN